MCTHWSDRATEASERPSARIPGAAAAAQMPWNGTIGEYTKSSPSHSLLFFLHPQNMNKKSMPRARTGFNFGITVPVRVHRVLLSLDRCCRVFFLFFFFVLLVSYFPKSAKTERHARTSTHRVFFCLCFRLFSISAFPLLTRLGLLFAFVSAAALSLASCRNWPRPCRARQETPTKKKRKKLAAREDKKQRNKMQKKCVHKKNVGRK